MNKEPDKHIIAGWKVWQNKNCQSCHQFYGLGGYMGPDLTNVISDSNKSAAYARGILKHGTSRMPDLSLNDTEIDDLIDFLTWVDKSGKNSIPDSAIHWTGTYIMTN